MQIKTATKEELALLINGLRSIWVVDLQKLQKRLLAQLESELSTRYGMALRDPREHGCVPRSRAPEPALTEALSE